jgi:hypothetical protein
MVAAAVADMVEEDTVVVVVVGGVVEVSLCYVAPVVPSADGTNKGGRW